MRPSIVSIDSTQSPTSWTRMMKITQKQLKLSSLYSWPAAMTCDFRGVSQSKTVATDWNWSPWCQETLVQCRCSVSRPKRNAQSDTSTAMHDRQTKHILSTGWKKTKLYLSFKTKILAGTFVFRSIKWFFQRGSQNRSKTANAAYGSTRINPPSSHAIRGISRFGTVLRAASKKSLNRVKIECSHEDFCSKW